jgi:RNA polymerase sigma-70 factor (ECF subfamily)
LSEQELLERLRAGNEPAYDSIFRAHYANLVGIAESMLHDRAQAEEVAQDVMLELWRRRATLVVETSLRAYLFRATRNRALNQLRHERVTRSAEPALAAEVTPLPAADNDVLQNEIDVALHAALDELPARCREVFELSRVHGLKYAEIARVLEISVKTVEAQMGKALRILREQLAPWLPRSTDL